MSHSEPGGHGASTLTDLLRAGTGGRPLRAAVLQAHGTHDEIMPSVFDVLLANGVEPTGYVSDRIQPRGDIFGPFTPYGDRIHYGDFTDREHWRRVGEEVADHDLLVINTLAYTGPATFARNLGLPTIGIVHNPPMMLGNPVNVELIRSGQCTPATLAPHVTAWMLAHRPRLLSKTVTLGAWMWQMPLTSSPEGPRRIGVPGAVDFSKRDFPAIVDALPALLADRGRGDFVVVVVGGGPDRAALEELVRERGLDEVFDFAPLDEASGQVLSHDFFGGLASCDVLLPHLPARQASYRVFKISAALSCSVGFGIPAVLDRWTAASYRVPCATYPVGDIVAGLQRALDLSDDDLAQLRAELAVERTTTIEQATAEMATAIAGLGTAPPEIDVDEPDDSDVAPPAVDPATVQRDDREAFLAFAAALLPTSHSQRIQDLWALWESGFSVDGYFCEFGALGGKDFSNSYLLERVGWDGVVAEPHPSYTKALYANRRCAVSTRCVYDRSGETVSFHTVQGRPALSTIGGFGADDQHREAREHFESHDIETITLDDLFVEAGAPDVVDYLSIDTEGSEVAILKAYDFERRPIRLICVEHNDVHREELFELLTSKGYERKWPELSGHDDWYVLRGSYPRWSAQAMAELVSRADQVEPFVRDLEIREGLLRELRPDRRDPRVRLGLPAWRPPTPPSVVPSPGAARAAHAFQRTFLRRVADQQGVTARQVNNRTLRLFHRLSELAEPTVVLEVGAFEGHYSRTMRRALPDAAVIAFEANPHVHAAFRDELTAAGVDYRHRAVTNRPGHVDVHVPRDLLGSRCQPVNQVAGLLPRLGTEQHEVVRVPAVRIDDVVGAEDRVVAWISAGGAAVQVLEGMDATLDRTMAVFVQVESEPVWTDQALEPDVAAHLLRRGFVLVGADLMLGDRERGLVFVHRRLARRGLVARLAAGVYRPQDRRPAKPRSTPPTPSGPPAPSGPATVRTTAGRVARRARRDASRAVSRLRRAR